MDESAITVGTQQIGYLDSGGGASGPGTVTTGGGRPVVFVHGNSASSQTWRELLAGPFGERRRCLALDLPGHGRSAPARDHAAYSLPGYAATLAGFCQAAGAQDAVIVGWSLGGHIAIEAAPLLPEAAGFLVFGTPPVASAAQMPAAFLPNPVLNVGFTAEVSPDEARAYAASFVAPGSALPLDEFVADILRTDGAARASLFASVGEGRFADEVEIVTGLGRPLAILHGAAEQLVSVDYLRQLAIPDLWRGAVQIVPGAGHAPHREAPQEFTGLLEQFIADVG
jgi:pimeloyl-ACP methyl ester carboxylesterase